MDHIEAFSIDHGLRLVIMRTWIVEKKLKRLLKVNRGHNFEEGGQ